MIIHFLLYIIIHVTAIREKFLLYYVILLNLDNYKKYSKYPVIQNILLFT